MGFYTTGIDLAPPIPNENWPKNCKFETCDVNHGLVQLNGRFDFIHARLISAGLRNFREAKASIEKCLKPGGFIVLLEADYNLLSSDYRIYLNPASAFNLSGSWTAGIFHGRLNNQKHGPRVLKICFCHATRNGKSDDENWKI